MEQRERHTDDAKDPCREPKGEGRVNFMIA
jgi:hypothetical protein